MSLLLSLLVACAEPAPTATSSHNGKVQDVPDDWGDPLIELGTGEWEWESLDGTTELPLIQGPQGGFHFLASVRVAGIEPGDAQDLSDPSNPTTQFVVWVDEEDITMTGTYVQGLDRAPHDAEPFFHEMIGRFVIVDILRDDDLDDVEFELSVDVTDVHGTHLSMSRWFTAYPHPFNHE